MNSSTLTSGTTRAPRWRRWGAIGTSSAAIAALTLVGVASPAAADEDSGESYARGQLLSGTVAGIDLARLVAVAPAEARNSGNDGRDSEADPLSATALDTVTVSIAGCSATACLASRISLCAAQRQVMTCTLKWPADGRII